MTLGIKKFLSKNRPDNSQPIAATLSLAPETTFDPSAPAVRVLAPEANLKKSPAENVREELARGGNISVIDLMRLLIEAGQEMRASDIHLDPEIDTVKFRFRIDGVLHDLFEAPKKLQDEIVSRIKILAALRTDEHQAAQDGRFRITLREGERIDVRVSIITIEDPNVAVGQRLVRRICSECRESKEITAAEAKSLEEIIPAEILKKHKVFYSGKGCEHCGSTGYKGRIGLHEVLMIDGPIREAILKKCQATEIRDIAIAQGMVPMVQDGFLKAAEGLTTIEEILRMQHE